MYSEKNRATSHEDYIRIFYDCHHPIWKEVQKTIVDFHPDIVGISAMTATLPTALKLAKIAKTVSKDVPVVMGGCHPTVVPMDVIKREEVDFVIQGEGEFSLVQLCDYLDKRNKKEIDSIKGLYYKKNGQIVQNGPNEFIDLSTLPLIRRDLLLYPEIYNLESYNRIMTSRGCPYKCTFCSSPAIWKRKVRYQIIEKVIEELNYLTKEYKVKRFRFWDDTFTLNKKYVIEFCKKLKKSNLRINWMCSVRANTVDKEMLQNLKETGCTSISLGIESGSDRILKLMQKGITVAMARKAVKMIKEEGFILGSFWMMGLPYEKEDDMMKTIGLMRELDDLDHINFCTFVPEPMTELYDLCIREGFIDNDIDWATKLDLSHHSTSNYFNKNVSKGRFEEIINEALKVVEIRNKRTLRRKLRSFWIQRRYFLTPEVIKQRIMNLKAN